MSELEAEFDFSPQQEINADINFDVPSHQEIDATFEINVLASTHNQLFGRDAENCHPISSITGLEQAIDDIEKSVDDEKTAREGADSNLQEQINEKQNTLTAGDGISIQNDTISNTGVLSIDTGDENGTISVDGNDVAVKGLESAAFTPATDYATAAQGEKADTAIQPNDNVSELTNDVGYITKDVDDLTNYTKTSDLSDVALSGSYDDLLDKPTIGDATITIQKNGSDVDTFTTNQVQDKTINITVPTQASDIGAQPLITSSAKLNADLVDDSASINKFVTSSDITTWNAKQDALTQPQLAAVNSGIDSTKVGQIATNTNDISDIEALIPEQASSSNQLADKNFVNSSIATNTANFIGTFSSVEELEEYSGTLTNNDYAFVTSTDEYGNTVYDRYKYTTATTPPSWVFEYELNNSSFTSDQWAAINSGITDTLVTQIGTNEGNISSLQSGKVDANSAITGATKCKITYDSKGLVTAGADLQASDIPSLSLSKISDITASASELNILDGATITTSELNVLDGITATTTELNYVDGVTSSIQTQLDGKVPTTRTVNGKALSSDISLNASDVGAVSDAKINNTSIVTSGVANIPIATNGGTWGVVKLNSNKGITGSSGQIEIVKPNNTELSAKTNNYKPIVPSNLDNAVMEGLGNNSLTWSDTYKKSARNTIGAVASVNNTSPDGNGNVSLTIPTVNDSTITITQGGVTKGSFTLNQASGDTIALDVGDVLPSQTGHSGEFLTTDGTDASWASINALQNTATGTDCLTILGIPATTSSNTINIGVSSEVNGWDAISIGGESENSTTYADTQGIALGVGAQSPTKAISIGYEAISNGEGCVCIGYDSSINSNVEDSVAVGRGSGVVNGSGNGTTSAVAIGASAGAWYDYSTAIGSYALAKAARAIQIGDGTNTEANSMYVGIGSNWKLLGSDGKIPDARLNNPIPSQTGNAGKFLTTDGTSVSWDNALSYKNISNCITEIPQDINLTLSSGVLTLKAGSKVYVPNGVGVFDVVTVPSDVVFHSGTIGSSTANFMLLSNANGNFGARATPAVYASGDNAPGNGYYYWYDTANNVIKYSENANNSWVIPNSKLSLPIGIYVRTSGVATSIYQVFNGIGYIGSTIFALPGVKGLIPSGRNSDGSLKNSSVSLTSVCTVSYTGTNTLYFGITGGNHLYYQTKSAVSYDESTNTTNWQTAIIAEAKVTSGVISDFKPKTVFHALDYNDKGTITGWSMPSDKYIDLTLGASGSTYTAPANGYFEFVATSNNSDTCMITMDNDTGGISTSTSGESGQYIQCFILCSRGDSIAVYYRNIKTFGNQQYDRFKFVYAKGEV